MKRLLVANAILVVFLFAACSKTKGPANGKSVQPNNNLDTLVSMSALINSTSWQTDSAFGYQIKSSGNDSGVVNLMITATSYDGSVSNTITFNITNFTGTQTYTINPPLVTATYYIGNIRQYARSGQIIVSSNTAYGLIGTFNFRTDNYNVVNGAFNVAQP